MSSKRTWFYGLAALVCVGCGGNGAGGGSHGDAGVVVDSGVPDAAVPDQGVMTDAAMPGQGDQDGGLLGTDDAAVFASCPGATLQQYLVDGEKQPNVPGDYALDIDGDGKPDNELGLLDQTLHQENLGLQDTQVARAAFAAGSHLLLIESSQEGDCKLASLEHAEDETAPPLDGGGSYVVDPTLPASVFVGRPSQPGDSAGFFSRKPWQDYEPVTGMVDFAILGMIVRMPAVGMAISWLSVGNGATLLGSINGAFRQKDVQNILVPTLAHGVTTQLQGPPTATTQQLKALFDNGGVSDPTGKCGSTCQNPDGTCAVANDDVVADCELANSPLLQLLLQPDVQLYAADGVTWQPTAGSTHPDSLSFGFNFSASPAQF